MSVVVAFQNEAELRLLLGRVGVREFRWSYANVCMYVRNLLLNACFHHKSGDFERK